MINIESERLIPLNQAGRHIPGRAGKPVSRATLFRWALKGRRGVKLESILLGDRLTSIEAITRFVIKLNNIPPAPTPADRTHEAEGVAMALKQEGFG